MQGHIKVPETVAGSRTSKLRGEVMKTLLFSGIFPKAHPRAGEPTNFVQSMKDGIKKHTIRANAKKHFKDGDILHFVDIEFKDGE